MPRPTATSAPNDWHSTNDNEHRHPSTAANRRCSVVREPSTTRARAPTRPAMPMAAARSGDTDKPRGRIDVMRAISVGESSSSAWRAKASGQMKKRWVAQTSPCTAPARPSPAHIPRRRAGALPTTRQAAPPTTMGIDKKDSHGPREQGTAHTAPTRSAPRPMFNGRLQPNTSQRQWAKAAMTTSPVSGACPTNATRKTTRVHASSGISLALFTVSVAGALFPTSDLRRHRTRSRCCARWSQEHKGCPPPSTAGVRERQGRLF